MRKENSEEYEVYEAQLQSLEKKNKSRLRIEAVLSLYSVLGLLVAVAGGVYFALDTLKVSLSSEQQMGLFLFILGLFMSICSRAVLVYMKQKTNIRVSQDRYSDILSEFVLSWIGFERIARQAYSANDENRGAYPVKQAMDFLEKEGTLNGRELSDAVEAMRVRNNLMHGAKEISEEAMREHAEALSELSAKIARRRGLTVR